VTTYKAEPGTVVAGVGAGGVTIGPFEFDEKGFCEVPDDFQEAHVVLATSAAVKKVKEKK
jgi:hypothetical protein